jgi:hypothetical protein
LITSIGQVVAKNQANEGQRTERTYQSARAFVSAGVLLQ